MSGAEPGKFEPGSGETPEPGRIGGVAGIEDDGLTVVSIEVEALASPDRVPVGIGAVVAEVSTAAPVEAEADPLHQSLLALVLAEALE